MNQARFIFENQYSQLKDNQSLTLRSSNISENCKENYGLLNSDYVECFRLTPKM